YNSLKYGPIVQLRLEYAYDPHFKSNEKLSVSNFPGKIIHVIGKATPITNDNELEAYMNNLKGALKVYHRAHDRRVVLVPISQIRENLKDSEGFLLYPGYLDEDGNIHHNIYVADAEGYKLNSKFIFTEDRFRMHRNPYWAEEFFEFEIDNDLFTSEGIIVYTTNFYAAYTFISGDAVISGLQDTIINLEHIDSVPRVLPDLDIPNPYKKRNRNVIQKSDLSIEMLQKINSLNNIIYQLARTDHTKKGTSPLFIDNLFLNFFEEENNRYSIEGFKNVLKKLNLNNADFATITRGIIQSDGTFIKNHLSRNQFYEAWFNTIKNDLTRQGGPLVFDIIRHGSLASEIIINNEPTDNQIGLIDMILQDIFGYPSFVCLLGGIMTFAEDASQSYGYRIDFNKHGHYDQSRLLNDFLGRNLYDFHSGDIYEQYFAVNPGVFGDYGGFSRNSFHWALTFLFGFKRDGAIITPFSDYFIENYFTTFNPDKPSDYRYAGIEYLRSTFSRFTSENNRRQMHIDGRIEGFDLMSPKLKSSFEIQKTITDPNIYHSGYEVILMNILMKNIMAPKSIGTDYINMLNRIRSWRTSNRFTLGQAFQGREWIGFEINNNDLILDFDTSKLTLNSVFTWLESYRSIYLRQTSSYFLDFDLVWNSGLDKDFMDAYKTLSEMLELIPKDQSPLKIELYARGKYGVDRGNPISLKPDGTKPDNIETEFRIYEIEVDLNNPAQAIISLLLWMMLEPNIFSVIRWGTQNFLYLDIYELFDQSYINSMSQIYYKIEGNFVWTEGASGTFTPEAFENFRDKFSRIFQYRDIMYFLAFHNHETDDRYSSIIDYIMDKILDFFKNRKILDRNSEIFDLR
ncbi:MAG: hypothetical protein ACXACY_14320, partial [Candidatus Hodarchaeales archaeon]